MWENYFDSIPLKYLRETWLSPLKQHEVLWDVPANLSPDGFVSWALTNVAGKPSWCNKYIAMRLLRDIQWKSTTENIGGVYFNEMSAIGLKAKRKDFTKEDALNELKGIADNNNYWEKLRCQKLKVVPNC
jgi:hypothetical protein